MILLVKESTVVRETVQLLMEHGHMRLVGVLLTVMLMGKFVVREDQDQLPYIQLLDAVGTDLIQMATTHVVLKGAVSVLECIKLMT